MRSMTGFGKGIAERDGLQIQIELKSVNHKFLDLNIKMPRQLNMLEELVRQTLNGSFKRGHIDAFINYKNTKLNSKNSLFDKDAVDAFMTGSLQLRKSFRSAKQFKEFQLQALIKSGELFKSDTEEELPVEHLEELVKSALAGACEQLIEMRVKEGSVLERDLRGKIQEICSYCEQVRPLIPQLTADYQTKMIARIKALLGEVTVDEAKLLNEVAFFVDKSNIDEELTRLQSHIEQIVSLFNLKDEPIGRRLDFLTQELNREVNTLCSKSANIHLTNLGLNLKNEVEKFREQIQNLE